MGQQTKLEHFGARVIFVKAKPKSYAVTIDGFVRAFDKFRFPVFINQYSL